jgi:signal recognition particle GTPase
VATAQPRRDVIIVQPADCIVDGMMEEVRELRRNAPHGALFVADGMTGQIPSTWQTFNEAALDR